MVNNIRLSDRQICKSASFQTKMKQIEQSLTKNVANRQKQPSMGLKAYSLKNKKNIGGGDFEDKAQNNGFDYQNDQVKR